MATETPSENEEPLTPQADSQDKGSKFAKIKKILIFAVPAILLLAGSGFYFFVLKAPKAEEKESHDAVHEEEKNKVGAEQYFYVDMDPITIALAPSGAKTEYLKIDISIKLGSEKEKTAVTSMVPIIKDTLITFLRSLRSTDFNSSSSTIYLKEELTKRINKITAPIMIKEVLFQEITIN